MTTGVPWESLSPTLTLTSLTTPDDGAGTSMVALSDSSVTRDASASIRSPGFTRTSMTGMSLKSPMSGTSTSCTVAIRLDLLDRHRVGLFDVESVLLDRLGDLGDRQLALVRQRLERVHRHPVAVHLDEVAQLGAGVAAAEPVGAEHAVAPGQVGADRGGVQLHACGGPDHRALPAL